MTGIGQQPGTVFDRRIRRRIRVLHVQNSWRPARSIDGSGAIRRDSNFLVRTREQWLAHGFAVAIPDGPGGSPWGSRLSKGNLELVQRVVEAAHARSGAPVWLVGTSMGTISAAGGAGRLTAGEIAGVVLTSSVTRPNRGTGETVFGADLDRVTVPALVVSNKDDRCGVTPPLNFCPVKDPNCDNSAAAASASGLVP